MSEATLEYRNVQASLVLSDVEVRRKGTRSKVLRGTAAVFNSRSQDMGGWFEMIAPGAFRRSIEAGGVAAVVNHDPDQLLGKQSSETLELRETETGLEMQVEVPDTQTGRDLIQLVTRGDADQMSFGFSAAIDDWKVVDNQYLRILHEVDLVEVSALTGYQAAYPQTNMTVKARSSYLSKRDELIERWGHDAFAALARRFESKIDDETRKLIEDYELEAHIVATDK